MTVSTETTLLTSTKLVGVETESAQLLAGKRVGVTAGEHVGVATR